jgi:ethanolamine utilization microcompartment shell protein EutS
MIPIGFLMITITPGEVAWIMSGLNLATAENILGLNASESGTFWYNGHGKLRNRNLGN